jgi:hypothetical protein
MVKEFAADLVEKELARATIRIIVSNLCTVFSHAVEDGIVQADPATHRPKYFKQAWVVHEEIPPLSGSEVEIFLSAAIEHDQKKSISGHWSLLIQNGESLTLCQGTDGTVKHQGNSRCLWTSRTRSKSPSDEPSSGSKICNPGATSPKRKKEALLAS